MKAFLENNKPLVAGVSVSVVVAAIIFLFVGRHPDSPKLDEGLHEAIGRTLAEEVGKVAQNEGAVVVVVPVCQQTRLRAVEMQLAAFEKSLKSSSNVQILAQEKIQTLTPRVDGLLTAELYFQLKERYPNAKAIVSFAGVGYFRKEELDQYKDGSVPICAVSMSELVPQELFDNGLVRSAITPPVPRAPDAAGTHEFANVSGHPFQIVTP